jgi:hypothetical protein
MKQAFLTLILSIAFLNGAAAEPKEITLGSLISINNSLMTLHGLSSTRSTVLNQITESKPSSSNITIGN